MYHGGWYIPSNFKHKERRVCLLFNGVHIGDTRNSELVTMLLVLKLNLYKPLNMPLKSQYVKAPIQVPEKEGFCVQTLTLIPSIVRI